MKKVTIQDIADALGISRNTVSKAINNSEGLAESTREKILQKAVEMGYKQFSYISALTALTEPTLDKSQLSPGFQGEIALLTTVFLAQSHFASTMLDKFQQEVSQLGYTLSIHRISPEDLAKGTLPSTFVRERTSAILCIEVFDKAYADMICSQDLPVLFVDGPVKRFGDMVQADQLYMDNVSGIARLTSRMLEKGCRRIGFVGDYNHCQSFFERYCCFRGNMALAGFLVEEKYIFPYSGAEALEHAFRSLDQLPEALICTNDFAAFDAINALTAMGKTVPEDVLVSGFDDCTESRSFRPPLTTVHIHTQAMAYSAVQLLMTRIKEPALDFRIVYTETDLIERKSTSR